MFTVTIKNNGQPVRRAFVKLTEGVPPFANETETMTDANGQINIDPSGTIQVQVFAHSPVVRLISHNLGIPYSVSENFTLATLPNNVDQTVYISNQNTHFEFMLQLTEIYNNGCRRFAPWNNEEFTIFPPLQRTANQFIEMIEPDNLPEPTAFVEPRGTITGFPLIHPGQSTMDRKTLAHELGHALHFQALPEAKRIEGETKYLAYLANHLHDPGHYFTKRTSPMVAYIEAFGAFTAMFEEFYDPTLSATDLYNNFFENALGSTSDSALRGDDVEGAVFAALFVDFAKSPGIGLPFVVKSYISSEALTFAEYAEYIRATYGQSSAEYAALKKVAAHRRMFISVLRLNSHCLHQSGSLSLTNSFLNGETSLKARLKQVDCR